MGVILVFATAGAGDGLLPTDWLRLLPWAAFIAFLGTVVGALLTRRGEIKDRRRDLCSEAYQQPLRWVELLYRVRRRCPGKEADLISVFHDVQERIHYFQGWLHSEAPSLARSYCRFADHVREQTRPLIQQAWQEDPHPVTEPMNGLAHPDIGAARDRFLRDLRAHLSPWPGTGIVVWLRNRKGASDAA